MPLWRKSGLMLKTIHQEIVRYIFPQTVFILPLSNRIARKIAAFTTGVMIYWFSHHRMDANPSEVQTSIKNKKVQAFKNKKN